MERRVLPEIMLTLLLIGMSTLALQGNVEASDTVYFTIDTPPNVVILSPENKTYPVDNVPLDFIVDEATSWIGYSLDGGANVTISGNTTLVGLSDGSHSLTVYANDTAGNMGSSDTVHFTFDLYYEIELDKPLPPEDLPKLKAEPGVIVEGNVEYTERAPASGYDAWRDGVWSEITYPDESLEDRFIISCTEEKAIQLSTYDWVSWTAPALNGTRWTTVPTAYIDLISPNLAEEGETVNFEGQGSWDPDGYIVEYRWESSRDGQLSNQASFSSSSLSVGTHTISFKVKDDDEQWSDPDTETLTIILDNTPPTTTVTLSGVEGDNGWFKSEVTVALSATDDISGVDKTEYSFDNVNWIVYATPFLITNEGDVFLYYRSTDKAGNIEATKNVVIKIDKTSPYGSIVVNSGDGYSTSTSVMLTLAATDDTSGVYQVRYSNDNVWDTESWETFATTKTWTLTSGDGTKTVYYQIKDKAGLVSDTYSDTILLDTAPPTGSITIAGGVTYTNSTSVTITLFADEDTAQMRFSNDGTNWSDWELYATSKSWILSTGDGAKTVYVQFMDNAGLTSQYKDTIILDTTKPPYQDTIILFPLWVVLVIIIVGFGVSLSGYMTYNFFMRRRANELIERHLARAEECFRKDVIEREEKIKKFKKKYGISIRPESELDKLVRKLDLQRV